MKSPIRPPMDAALVLCALGAFAACASGPGPVEEQLAMIQDLTREGAYVEAAAASVDLLERLPEDSPRHREALEAKHQVSLASQMDHARALTLSGDDDEALAIFTRLEAEYPGVAQVAAWRKRTQRKLGDRWFTVAREALANESYAAARKAYGEVLKYNPNHPVAGLSIEDLKRLEEYRAELGADYYSGGVRDFVELRLSEARADFQKSLKYAPGNARAERRITEVNRERAKARVESAKVLAEDGRFAAAAQEYVAALALDPDDKEIQAGLESMQNEAKAYRLLGDADFMVMRGQVDRAEETLKEGASLTALQSKEFAAAIDKIDEARVDSRYQKAVDLEHDFQFPEAVVAYKEILEGRDFYKDVRARIGALEGYIANAKRLYAEAKAASTPELKLEALQQIDVFWPEYRDVAEQISALRD